MKRGDVVVVEFPYTDGRRGKNRPSVVVQNDVDDRRLTNTILAMISGNIRYSSEPAQVLVDPGTNEGQSSGLHGPSVVKCGNIYTVRQQDIARVVGKLSDPLLRQVDDALNAALGLS